MGIKPYPILILSPSSERGGEATTQQQARRRRATLGLLSVARALGIAAAMVEPAPVLFVVGVCNVVNVLAEA
eukprot:scaffold112160_cov94-Phaeocystis_antarctica.AAC.1